jgi:hypothetical protein
MRAYGLRATTFFAVRGAASYDPCVRRLSIVSAVFAVAIPAHAQQLTLDDSGSPPAIGERSIGLYAGVEPGEAQPPPAFRRITRLRQRRRAAILTWPGFTPLGDGGSRFFVQTTDPVAPELRVEQGRIVLLFPNTTIHVRNSARWLETRFFNTPVVRARLERRRRHMAFVLYLRAPSSPRISSEPGANGTFHYTYLDFPPGEYAPVIAPAPAGLEPGVESGGLSPNEPPPAPMRELDPSLRELDDERPPGLEAGD